MTDDRIELTRRKILAATGAVGAAGATAGIGTSAFFSDEEEFDDNTVVAGELDMKVDWEEHYSDWSDDEAEGGVDVTMSEPSSPSDYYAFPVGASDPELWVNRSDAPGPNGESSLELFMDNTTTEAFPDSDDDGVQDEFAESNVCSDNLFADVPDDMDPTAFNRTLNADTYDRANDEPLPLINLDDVKPGDFGEVTFSFHLCTNPGYVWMNADNVSAAENGNTEPEAEDPDESGPDDEVLDDSDLSSAEIELLDEVQTALWYDGNCNNLIDGDATGSGADPCVQLVLDASFSMNTEDGDDVSRNQEAINGAQSLAEQIINAGGRVGVTFFSADGYDESAKLQQSVSDSAATNISDTKSTISNLPASGGSTAIGEGILTADDDLSNCTNGEQAVQIVVTDGSNNAGTDPSTAADNVTGSDSDDYTEEIFAVGTGGATESQLLTFARPMNDEHTFLTEQGETLEDLLDQLGGEITSGEQPFFTGSLREALLALTDGNGIPLDGDTGTAYDELNEPADADARECFPGESTQCIGFSWYLPVDHANEIQTDSVSFDLGFYTEQCRHNDGSGQAPEGTQTPTA